MQKSLNHNDAPAASLSSLGRKLMFRSWHRGTREMDLIMGRFADVHLPQFDDVQLKAYEALMEESDPDLYNWITGQEPLPLRCANDVVHMLIQFYRR